MATSVVLSLLVLLSGNPSPAPDSNAAEKRLRYLAARLDAMVHIKEKENTLGLLLSDLAEQASEPQDKQKDEGFAKHVSITLDIRGFAEGVGGRFEPEVFQIKFATPMKITLGAALEMIAEQLPDRGSEGAGVVVRNDAIELRAISGLRIELNAPYKRATDFRRLVVSFFDKMPLETALKELEKKHNRSIVVSPLAEKAIAQPITARFVNVPFDTAVEVLADLADLKVVQKANVFFVTTKEQAAALIREQKKRLIEEKKRYKGEKPQPPI